MLRLKGRHWVVLWLLLFLAVTGAVVARQAAGLGLARRLRALRAERATLEARRADLERRIREAGSRQVLVPRAERLGLHVPTSAEFVLFGVPRADSTTTEEER